MSKYSLKCTACGKTFSSDRYTLRCDEDHAASFLRTDYAIKQIKKRNENPGMFKYIDWLPVEKPLKVSEGPVTYKSEGLAKELGLSDLYIVFSGYWPEKGATMKTCTFKELEAPPTIQRILETSKKPFAVASAGNTARAFAHACSLNDMPVCLVVNEAGLELMWLPEEPIDKVKLVLIEGDYLDAIRFSSKLCKLTGMLPEGGARNVARRDGMGTCAVNAILEIGEIPDHYFQAIGSGTGAIASWEVNLRFIEDGRFGRKKMKLNLSQNLPFTPIFDSWKAGSRQLVEIKEEEAKKRIDQIYAKVLSNRSPPYSIIGGDFDALSDTSGEMYAVSNDEALSAEKLFYDAEGIDLLPSSAVAVGSLIQACKANKVSKRDKILLNITGGGFKRLEEDFSICRMQPDIKTKTTDEHAEVVVDELDLNDFAKSI